MKRLDKPTKHGDDSLLNIQKEPDIQFKILSTGKLSECLKSKTTFLWLPVFKSKKTYFSENQISHVHLKPEKTETAVDGEEI
jgi:hypothetical protein